MDTSPPPHRKLTLTRSLDEERNWILRVASEFVFHPDTDAPLHEERVTAFEMNRILHLIFTMQYVIYGTISCSCAQKRAHSAAFC